MVIMKQSNMYKDLSSLLLFTNLKYFPKFPFTEEIFLKILKPVTSLQLLTNSNRYCGHHKLKNSILLGLRLYFKHVGQLSISKCL